MRGDSGQFPWARERLRVLSADTPQRRRARIRAACAGNKPLTDAQRYGLALARLLDGQPAVAAQDLAPLLRRTSRAISGSRSPWPRPKHARAKSRSADARFEALIDRMPNNRAVALTYAGILDERNTPAAGKRAQAVLRPAAGQRPA